MKSITNAQKVSLQNQTVKSKVEQLLNWSEQKYCDFQFAMAYEYLELEYEGKTALVNAMVSEHMFWSWWVNHWVRRDQIFLNKYEDRYNRDLLITYKIHHNPQAISYKPHATILRHSYAKMIGKMIDIINA